MFGPPKSRPASKMTSEAKGKCSTAASVTGSQTRKPVTSATTTLNSNRVTSNGNIKKLSGSLAGSTVKSTSRSSILSDTSNSVCSSSLTSSTTATVNKSNSINRRIEDVGRKPASITRTNSSISNRVTGGGSSSISGSYVSAGSRSRSVPSSVIITSSSGSSSCATSSSSRRVPTLAMSMRDKDQQIKLLIKERDEHRCQAELMARRAEEWEEKFLQSEVEKSHVTSEADDEVIELRRLAQEFEDENKKLIEKLNERDQILSDTQFKLDEIECDRSELEKSLREKEREVEMMEQAIEQAASEQVEQEASGANNDGDRKQAMYLNSERAISKAKYEKEIEDLKEKIMSRDEQMIQLRSSLEMRRNEVNNLQAHSSDLERKLKIESERSERHLKRIDEINLELKASEAKLTTKTEENEVLDKQVRQLRQELRATEEKLEQISLARKKDVDILHNKLALARQRAGSSTPTSPQPQNGNCPSQFKTPTPQDEIVRLQMEIRDLKDQLIDREAELDCNRRDIEVMRKRMETRTLDVDCNNQELARRCQDLLEQNRQSEDTVKQLLKSTTEHSAQLMRATDDLKEANGKCIKMRDEINELEAKLDEQLQSNMLLNRENSQLKEQNNEYIEQIQGLSKQVNMLNNQLSDLCEQLDVQTDCLHKDRESLADRLSHKEIELAQLQHDLSTSRQDLRTNKLVTQEVVSERDRLRADLLIKDKYISSRNDIISTLRLELEDSRKSLTDCKQKIEDLRQSIINETDKVSYELKNQIETLKSEYVAKCEENLNLMGKCERYEKELKNLMSSNEEEELKRFDDMRRKHSAELDALRERIQNLEIQLDEAKSSTIKRSNVNANIESELDTNDIQGQRMTDDSKQQTEDSVELCQDSENVKISSKKQNEQQQADYESQIDFLNSLVVDMQRKCDDYKNRLAQIETLNIMNEFDNLIISNKSPSKHVQISQQNLSQNKKQNSNLITPRTCRISGRPFCDICNVFDQHHTLYCPKVSQKIALHESASLNNNNNNNNIDNNINNNISNINNNNNNNDNDLDERASSKNKDNIQMNNNNNPNIRSSMDDVDAMFRDYEQSIHISNLKEYSSLRRCQTLKPYCDHCDLYGHSMKACNALRGSRI